MAAPAHHYLPDFEPTDNYVRGMAAYEEGQLNQCIRILEAEPANSPCFGLALGNSALAYLRKGNAPAAEDMARRALEEIGRNGCPHPPSHVQFLRHYGEALCQQGQWNDALNILDQALALADRLAHEHPRFESAFDIQRADTHNSLGNTRLHYRAWGAAIDCYQDARTIYERHRAESAWALAYTLTNLGLVWNVTGQHYRAESALMEARGIIDAVGDLDQQRRIDIALIQLGSAAIPPDQRLPIIRRAAEAVAEDSQTALAFTRFCIGAEIAEKDGAVDEGFRMLADARALLPLLQWDDFGAPRLVNVEAGLMEQAGRSSDQIICLLVAGAALWYNRITQPLPPEDFNAVSSSLHDHFRRLARHLLNRGRSEESLLAFETGRALGYAVEVDVGFIQRVLHHSPFATDGSSIDLTLIREAQASIALGEVAIVVCALPPDVVAFLVERDRVTHVSLALPEGHDAIDTFTSDIKKIPGKLEGQEGSAAIPGILHDLGRVIADRIDGRLVRALYPYAFFHAVPWRAVLRANGVDWQRMPFAVGFGLLMRDEVTTLTADGMRVTALGHGASRRGLDFTDENRAFARHFGERALVSAPCSEDMLRNALASDEIVFLSSHGEAEQMDGDVRLMLLLADTTGQTVRIAAEQVVPLVVRSPYVILCACYSGAYQMAWGDYPVGGAPLIVRRGAKFCLCTRFAVNSEFTASFFDDMGSRLAAGADFVTAFIASLASHDGDESHLWENLACLELLRRV